MHIRQNQLLEQCNGRAMIDGPGIRGFTENRTGALPFWQGNAGSAGLKPNADVGVLRAQG